MQRHVAQRVRARPYHARDVRRWLGERREELLAVRVGALADDEVRGAERAAALLADNCPDEELGEDPAVDGRVGEAVEEVEAVDELGLAQVRVALELHGVEEHGAGLVARDFRLGLRLEVADELAGDGFLELLVDVAGLVELVQGPERVASKHLMKSVQRFMLRPAHAPRDPSEALGRGLQGAVVEALAHEFLRVDVHFPSLRGALGVERAGGGGVAELGGEDVAVV
mmetsp:Transcript_19919/g.49451  ORF Transcript_19919/g.49451 Transcript_19919/m.49451 type:complete len:227 (+) Transcript_19919:1335-2015(+)